MRCVFDTNVLISALLIPASIPRQALNVASRSAVLLMSKPLISELHDVLTRKDFSRYIDEEDVLRFIAVLSRDTEFVEVDARLSVCRDPNDNKLLELAVSGRATHLITGDSDLLTLHPFQNIDIVMPRIFLEGSHR